MSTKQPISPRPASKKEVWVAVGTFVLFGIFLGIFFFIILPRLPHTSNKIPSEVIIESGWSLLGGKKASVYKKDGMYTISYTNERGGKESFIVSGHIANDPLAESLLSIAQEPSAEPYSPFVDGADKGQHKVVDITLDVSGSVQTAQKGDAGYLSRVAQNLGKVLTSSNVNLRPGDTVNVRFLDFDKSIYVINFKGPKFNYSVVATSQLSASKRGLITLGTYEFSKSGVTSCNYVLQQTVDEQSIAGVVDQVSCMYGRALQKYSDEHKDGESPLLDKLADIARDNTSRLGKYSSVVYVLVTDGEFNLSPALGQMTGVMETCGSMSYERCHPDISSKLTSILGGRNLSVSGAGKDDFVYFIGVDFHDNPPYRDSLTKLIDDLFAPIPVDHVFVNNNY